jgi:hypothetical protein
MRYAYRVWHSEESKSAAKRASGRVLNEDEIRICHESLETLVAVSYQSQPQIQVSVLPLQPVARGLIFFLEMDAGEDKADASIAECLSRINRTDADLCFVAEPLGATFSTGSSGAEYRVSSFSRA